MLTLDFYKEKEALVNFYPLTMKREWMEDTDGKHAYRCFPVSSANLVGWTFSFPEDITFIWDGVSDTFSDHIKIIKGHKFVNLNRANATISFDTNLYLKTNNDISIMIMPVPNQFIEGTNCFTTIINPSILKAPIPAAWRITLANKEITIPANTPIASIIPISLKGLQDVSVNLYDAQFGQDHYKFLQDYGMASQEKTMIDKWTNFYRDGIDHEGNKLGDHEVKTLKLSFNDYTKDSNG
jgi:hypothetical protein